MPHDVFDAGSKLQIRRGLRGAAKECEEHLSSCEPPDDALDFVGRLTARALRTAPEPSTIFDF